MARYPDENGNWYASNDETLWLDVTAVHEPGEAERYWLKFGRNREGAISRRDLVDLRDFLDHVLSADHPTGLRATLCRLLRELRRVRISIRRV